MALVVDVQLLSLSDMYGSLQSPNFPEPYPRETELRWNVSVPRGFQIKLYFSHFDLEPSYLCEYDFVKVRHQGNMGSFSLLREACYCTGEITPLLPVQQSSLRGSSQWLHPPA
uniref:CUB domain-containing protein n=1 Tax=Seriola lalandi dorsalis TaxID=1841481 RepID=A0A3B4WEB7_SERLL